MSDCGTCGADEIAVEVRNHCISREYSGDSASILHAALINLICSQVLPAGRARPIMAWFYDQAGKDSCHVRTDTS